jgi:TonB family protein
METLASAEFASPETEPELNLLLERDRRGDWRRWRKSAVVSVAVHLILLTVLLVIPETESRVYEQPLPTLHFTPLYTPTELTQKDPNKGKLSKELTIAAIPPRPATKSTTPVPPAKRAAPPPPPVPQIVKAEPKPVIVEPPKIETPKSPVDLQAEQLAKLNSPLPPPTQQLKIVLENVAAPPPPAGSNQGKPLGGIALPSLTAESAIHDLATNGASLGGHQSVDAPGAEPAIAGRNLPASPGNLPANLELRSDPQGVDFKPYMMQVLAAVRRNWFAVYPETARMGARGQVVLEFAIAKQGVVTKVILPGQSGSKPLDEAAIAAISASNPLPPLPKDFKGDRIVLRMTFMYNMKR